MKTLIIIPTYNKYNQIIKMVNEFNNSLNDCDYILINDGSNDRTNHILENNEIPHLTHPIHCGFSASIKTGITYAYENDYDYLVSINENDYKNFKYIKEMIDLMKTENVDLIQASRYSQKGKGKKVTLSKINSNIISLFIFMTTFKKITDPTNSMRMFSKSLIKELALNLNNLSEPDTISHLIKNKYAFKELYVPPIQNKYEKKNK